MMCRGFDVGLIRVQLMIDEDQDSLVRCEAHRLGISKSELVRRAIDQVLRPEIGNDDPLYELIGFLEGDEADDVSVHHDTYLYGGEMKA
jgi:hypothetical protein